MLLGSLSAGALTSCGPNKQQAAITASDVYTNNHYVSGVGFYHAPFRAWYPHPYNMYDEPNHRYYYGGQWGPAPHHSITNISSPTPQVAAQAQAQRTDVRRNGFGSTSHRHSTWS